MGAQIGRKAGVFFFWAAALSLLLRRGAQPAPFAPAAKPQPAAPAARPARQPRRMWALVQVLPEVKLLAISASRAELERELAEINETWNHWALRGERQRYVIQPAPVLYPAPPEPGPRIAPAGAERTEG